MTKKKVVRNFLADENRKVFREKVKSGKFYAENFFGNREGNVKQGKCSIASGGMDAPERTALVYFR